MKTERRAEWRIPLRRGSFSSWFGLVCFAGVGLMAVREMQSAPSGERAQLVVGLVVCVVVVVLCANAIWQDWRFERYFVLGKDYFEPPKPYFGNHIPQVLYRDVLDLNYHSNSGGPQIRIKTARKTYKVPVMALPDGKSTADDVMAELKSRVEIATGRRLD